MPLIWSGRCAGGSALAGLSDGFVGLCVALALAGAGTSTQHPPASAVVPLMPLLSSRLPLEGRRPKR